MGDCPTCGRELDQHDRHVRFRLPDPVLRTDDQDRAPGTWMSHENANSSVMLQVPGLGAFVRALLPVSLTAGHTVTFSTWVAIHPDELYRAFSVWWAPDYPMLELDGFLANQVQPWAVLGAPVHLVVRDPEQTPYCATSQHPELASVLTQEWDHELVLSGLP